MVVSESEQVLWHDLECGGYRADLPLWRRLAGQACGSGGAVLDIGAGTGRVALDLARAGYAVTAVDIDPALVAELARRAEGLPLDAVCGDARSFALERSDHCLCLVPMQTVQLLRGPRERRALLERARAHMRPGALLALAIVTDVEQFDATGGELGPAPERVRAGSRLYVSRPVRVVVDERFIRIERERFAEGGPVERNLIELERVTAAELFEDARAAGLTPERELTIAPTEEHSGSEVVVLRA